MCQKYLTPTPPYLKPITLDLKKFPMLEARQSTPFFVDFFRFSEDRSLDITIVQRVNSDLLGVLADLAMWESWRGVWGRRPWKPLHPIGKLADWKLADCKCYFGLKGPRLKMIEGLKAIQAEVQEIYKIVESNEIHYRILDDDQLPLSDIEFTAPVRSLLVAWYLHKDTGEGSKIFAFHSYTDALRLAPVRFEVTDPQSLEDRVTRNKKRLEINNLFLGQN